MIDRRSSGGTLLVVPAKRDDEHDAVVDAWLRRGEVHRLDRFWDPPALDAPLPRTCIGAPTALGDRA